MLKSVPEIAGLGVDVFASLVSAIGTQHMAQALFDGANHIGNVVEIFGFTLEGDDRPQPVEWIGDRADASGRVSAYIERFYLLDPLVRDLRRAERNRAVSLRLTRASTIADSEYRWYCFDHPGLQEKLSIARPTDRGWSVINFYSRSRESPADVVALTNFGVFALAALEQHGRLLPLLKPLVRSENQLESVVERLRHRFPRLPRREAEVCARTMFGLRSPEIARDLSITAATVLTYRRRAYERLGISNAAQLVRYLVD